MKAWIPNVLTLLNLFCGCAAIVCLHLKGGQLGHRQRQEDQPLAVTRKPREIGGLVSSRVGKELDSLADMVSFGVVPGII
ncbi:MAG: CDP-diacylglycerol O-phosphatidyltransferase, partial [Bacteroidota bacterium]